MQKWEYMTWVIGHAATVEPHTKWKGGRIKYLNGELLPNWQNGAKLIDSLNDAGSQGWELVTINYTSTLNADPIYIFKRPAV